MGILAICCADGFCFVLTDEKFSVAHRGDRSRARLVRAAGLRYMMPQAPRRASTYVAIALDSKPSRTAASGRSGKRNHQRIAVARTVVITRAQKIEDGAYTAGTPGSQTAEAPNYTAR